MTPEERAARALGSAEAEEGFIQDAVAREIREAVADALREKRRARKIERNARPKAKRATPRRSGRVKDESFLAWVRRQTRCIVDEEMPGLGCDGGIEANHLGDRPFGRKADDDTAAPMCSRHHRHWTDYVGIFSPEGQTKAERRAWANRWISTMRERYLLEGFVLVRYAS